MTIFHYRPADTLLSRMNPNAKLVALLVYCAVVSSADAPLKLVMSTLPALLAWLVHLPLRAYLRQSVFFILMALCLALSSWVEEGGMIEMAASGAGFLSMVLSSMLFADSTMPDDLARSLAGALSHVMGKAAYGVASLVEVTLAMIPAIVDSAGGLYEARRARGASFIRHPLSSMSSYAAGVLGDLLDKAGSYADALYSRGYDNAAVRHRPRYRTSDVLVIAFSLLAGIMFFMFPVVAD